jgi:hypothetical protein
MCFLQAECGLRPSLLLLLLQMAALLAPLLLCPHQPAAQMLLG